MAHIKRMWFVWMFVLAFCRPGSGQAVAAESEIYQRLKAIPDIEIKALPPEEGCAATYELGLSQPLDHDNASAGEFRQRLFLTHVDVHKPMVLSIEGYEAGKNYLSEVRRILGCNELRVEHRYFGESAPATVDWKYLNTKQAAADCHRIATLFKKIYDGKWISIGWSKGGETALIYRKSYPEDVAATIAYDAPINFALEDSRIDAFFEKVGTPECRQKLIHFQRMILKHKKDVLPLFEWYAKGKGYAYSIGLEKALEYCVLEYPFSFWQYTEADCREIPDEEATPGQMLEHLRKTVSFYSYSDYAMNSPAMYQFSTELGYYGYVKKNVKDLLSSESYPNTAFAPQDTPLNYSPKHIRDLDEWLRTKGDNIIYVYGAQDPWAAPAIESTGRTNALKMVLKGGNHFTFIDSFPKEQRDKILTTLENWLGVTIEK